MAGCSDPHLCFAYLHLEVSDEPLQSDFLVDLQEETVAAQHHALQDVQGHLLDRCIRHLCINKTGNLKGAIRKWGKRRETGEENSQWKPIGDEAEQSDRQPQIEHLLDEDWREVLPRDYTMIHQFHEACQCVGHDHRSPDRDTHTETCHVHLHTNSHYLKVFSILLSYPGVLRIQLTVLPLLQDVTKTKWSELCN